MTSHSQEPKRTPAAATMARAAQPREPISPEKPKMQRPEVLDVISRHMVFGLTGGKAPFYDLRNPKTGRTYLRFMKAGFAGFPEDKIFEAILLVLAMGGNPSSEGNFNTRLYTRGYRIGKAPGDCYLPATEPASTMQIPGNADAYYHGIKAWAVENGINMGQAIGVVTRSLAKLDSSPYRL